VFTVGARKVFAAMQPPATAAGEQAGQAALMMAQTL
jgi:hypothetical protein